MQGKAHLQNLEILWRDIKEKHRIPDQIIAETEEKIMKNSMRINIAERTHHIINSEELQHRLAEHCEALFLSDPLLWDAASQVSSDIKIIITDPNGIVLSSQCEDIVGFLCPAAELIYSDAKMREHLEMGSAIQITYEDGMCSQLLPIFNEQGRIVHFWGVSSYHPIDKEITSILYIVTQLAQQRYNYAILLNQYTSSFMDAMSECAILIDEKGRILNVNERLLQLTGTSSKNLLKGLSFGQFISGDSPYKLFQGHEKYFYLNCWAKRILCYVVNVQAMETPFGRQMLILFNGLPEKEPLALESPNALVDPFESIVTNSAEMLEIKHIAKKAAKSAANILIEGESGTGKEVLAEAIHRASGRQGRFVAINCGAIPSQLVQSELFGYEGGAFTGANKQGHMGKFELADGGTVFLDEISEMPFEMQVNLLRFLQDRTITRIGGKEEKKLDVRIIAATNKNLADEIQKGRFREDLYYRLNVISITLPPLRERKGDIPLLADYFLDCMAAQYEEPRPALEPEMLAMLKRYDWPGNVRELQNTIEKAFVLAENGKLNFYRFGQQAAHNFSSCMQTDLSEADAKEQLEQVLLFNNWNVTRTAKQLNVTRQTVYRRMKQYGISIPSQSAREYSQ